MCVSSILACIKNHINPRNQPNQDIKITGTLDDLHTENIKF